MRQHGERGERAAAARQFARLRGALHRELGLDPSPETVALYLELTRGPATGKVPGRSRP